jgi:hypothetical protein
MDPIRFTTKYKGHGKSAVSLSIADNRRLKAGPLPLVVYDLNASLIEAKVIKQSRQGIKYRMLIATGSRATRSYTFSTMFSAGRRRSHDREVLRKAEPNAQRRPAIHAGT